MIVTTMNDIPGYEVDEVFGEVMGLTANAIIAMRFDTSEMGQNWTEICAYGTAVRAKKAFG